MSEPVPWAIHFTNDLSEDVGALTFDEHGRLTFAGNADECAQIFFNGVIATNNDRMKELLLLLKVAKCPNEHCVDGTIQEGFGDGYEVFECQFCHERKAFLDG
jgi:hypothetical protein